MFLKMPLGSLQSLPTSFEFVSLAGWEGWFTPARTFVKIKNRVFTQPLPRGGTDLMGPHPSHFDNFQTEFEIHLVSDTIGAGKATFMANRKAHTVIVGGGFGGLFT